MHLLYSKGDLVKLPLLFIISYFLSKSIVHNYCWTEAVCYQLLMDEKIRRLLHLIFKSKHFSPQQPLDLWRNCPDLIWNARRLYKYLSVFGICSQDTDLEGNTYQYKYQLVASRKLLIEHCNIGSCSMIYQGIRTSDMMLFVVVRTMESSFLKWI